MSDEDFGDDEIERISGGDSGEELSIPPQGDETTKEPTEDTANVKQDEKIELIDG